MADRPWCFLVFVVLALPETLLVQAQEFCRGLNYWCKEGHCCGHGRCCTYYYELWYFWLVWLAVAMAGFCCFYQKRLWKNRREAQAHQDQQNENQPGGTTSLISRAANSLLPRPIVVQADPSQPLQPQPAGQQPPAQVGSLVEPEKLFKLPTYEEIGGLTGAPPPYSMFSPAGLPQTAIPPQATPGGQTQTYDVASLPPSYSLVSNLLPDEITKTEGDGEVAVQVLRPKSPVARDSLASSSSTCTLPCSSLPASEAASGTSSSREGSIEPLSSSSFHSGSSREQASAPGVWATTAVAKDQAFSNHDNDQGSSSEAAKLADGSITAGKKLDEED